ncbi:helix-turn-helix domain-containing protein [Streptomyces sp. NPDC020490]|uniref:nSTAND1 domain-containing NTPase n=1 Tax=Streptomyces sp. NPDC020490 TaxID=3365078 RepID=UPI00379B64D0
MDPNAGPVQRFAYELRKLRQEAGGITYREMARRAHYSVTALSQAAAGEQLPSLAVTLAYARACGGAAEEWERRWREADEESAVRERTDGEARSPYQGLARFEPDDHERFFGRDELVGRLLRLTADRRFSAVFGPSGSGKSSLLRAGLVPALRRPGRDGSRIAAVRILTPGRQPARVHAPVLRPAGGGAGGDTVVVVDQFEEVFTLCQDPAERTAFIDELLAARAPDSGLRVVIAVRADFYGRCAEHRALADTLSEAGLLVGPMSPAELREAVVRPAQTAGLIVERELTARLVREVADEPGGLPLLSHVLHETWRRRRGRALTVRAYEAAGGVHGAIAQSAEDAYARLGPEDAELARLVLLRLITPGEGAADTRRPVDRDELDFAGPGGSADLRRVLDQLARARLITLGHDTVDLAHEALITAWPRLSGWIDGERERLRVHRRLSEAARTWDELGRDPGALYRGTRLRAAREQLTETALTSLERAFLTASRAARRGERRRRRGVVGSLSVLVVLALVAGAVAWQQNRAGDRRRVEAEARRIAAVADSMRFSDPVTAMRLSVAGWRLADTTETRSALIGAMTQREEDVFPVPGADQGPDDLSGNEVRRLTSDGRQVVSVTADRVRTWDLRTHRLTRSVPGPGRLMDGGASVAVSPDGRTLAVATDEAVKLWDVRAARVTGTLAAPAVLEAPYFSRDGRTLVVQDLPFDTNPSVQVWDLRGHRRLLRIREGDDESLQSFALGPDGRTLALCTDRRGLEVWDVGHRRKSAGSWTARVRPGHCGEGVLAVSPDGRTLALTGDHGIRRWDLRTGRALPALESDPVSDARFSAHGDFVLAMSGRALLLWRSASPGTPVLTQRLPAGEAGDIAFDGPTGTVRYLNELGTVVRSLSLGRSTTGRWDQEKPARWARLSADGRVLARFRTVRGVPRLEAVDTRSGRVLLAPETDMCPEETPESFCSDLAAISPDGRYVAYGRGGEPDGGGVEASGPGVGADGPGVGADGPGVGADGSDVGADGRDGGPDEATVTVWDVRRRRTYATVRIRPADGGNALAGLALDSHARTLVVYRATDPVSAEVWDLRRRERVRSVHGSRMTGVTEGSSTGVDPVLNSAGDRLVTSEGVVAELRARGRVEPRLLGEGANKAAAFSPDGGLLASGDALGRVTVWNGTLRKRLGVLDTNASETEADTVGAVSALAFSHDGGTLAVAGEAGTVQLWDVASLRLLGSALPAPGDRPLALAFAPDDSALYAAGEHTPVQRYDLNPGHLAAAVCGRTGSGLSGPDWKAYLPNLPYRHTC